MRRPCRRSASGDACRAAGLRVQTKASENSTLVWAWQVNRVATRAEPKGRAPRDRGGPDKRTADCPVHVVVRWARGKLPVWCQDP